MPESQLDKESMRVNDLKHRWTPVVIAAVLSLPLIAAGGIAGVIALGRARPREAPIPTATLPFPTVRTLAPTATWTRTSTPAPTNTPTSTPTPTATPTFTPTPTPTPRVVTWQVRALGRLETAQFLMQSVVDRRRTPESVWDRVFGTDQLLLIAEGEVVAGFDMTLLSSDDIIVRGDAVTLTLPAPMVLYTRVDNEKTRVYERKSGLFRPPDPDIEAEARRVAELAMLDHAIEGGILEHAERNGVLQINAFLHSLGFTQTSVDVRPANR